MNPFKNIKWSPDKYKKASVVANQAGEELISRLTWMTLKPKVIIDMGSGCGEFTVHLKSHYQDAKIFALDLSESMLTSAKKVLLPSSDCSYVCADAEYLAFPNQSVDLIFANFLLPWHENLENLLREWKRVLRPQGLLIFTTLGIDTMHECKHLFNANELPSLIDMHDLGDLLMKAGFLDPVLDVDYFTLSYRNKKQLFDELIATGMWFPKEEDDASFAQVFNAFSDDQQNWEITYEVIYGHAFMPDVIERKERQDDGSYHVSLDTLKQALKKHSHEG